MPTIHIPRRTNGYQDSIRQQDPARPVPEQGQHHRRRDRREVQEEGREHHGQPRAPDPLEGTSQDEEDTAQGSVQEDEHEATKRSGQRHRQRHQADDGQQPAHAEYAVEDQGSDQRRRVAGKLLLLLFVLGYDVKLHPGLQDTTEVSCGLRQGKADESCDSIPTCLGQLWTSRT